MSTATATALKNKQTDFAVMSGSPKSPNLPYGTYDFVLTAAGDEVAILDGTSQTTNEDGSPRTYKYVEVVSSGQDASLDSTVKRRVYAGTLAVASSTKVMYNADGSLKATFTGGVYTDAKRNSVVSSDAKVVSEGISAANQRYTQEREAKKAAANTQE